MLNRIKSLHQEFKDWITGEDIAKIREKAFREAAGSRNMLKDDFKNLKIKGDKAHKRIKNRKK